MLAPRTICSRFCLGALLLAIPLRARGGESSLSAAFSRTARLEGAAYAAGRHLLERQGEKVLPFLKQKSKNADWRVRYLALSLALRIKRPSDVALWWRAFSGWDHEFTVRDDGTVHVQFDPKEREFVEKVLRGDLPYRRFGLVVEKLPPGNEAVLGRETIPVILDRLRGRIGGGSADDRRHRGWLRALEMLSHFAEPDTAGALLSFYCPLPLERVALVVGGLAKIGDPALPMLREAVRTCPTEWPGTNSREKMATRKRNGAGINLSAVAALALGRIGDREGALLIVGKLKLATYSLQVEAFSKALGQTRTPEGVPVVFKQLARTADICRRRRGGHSSEDPDYASVRRAMLSFGEVARQFLTRTAQEGDGIRERTIAGGLLCEFDNKEKVSRVYQSLGEAVLAERRKHLRPGTPSDPGDPVEQGKTALWHWGGSLPAHIELQALPFPLLAEHAYVSAQLSDLRNLIGFRDRLIPFDILADTLVLRKWDDREGPTLALLLARIGDDRAIEVYQKLLGDRPTRYISSLVEGMLLLGSDKAVPVLEEIVRRAQEGGRHIPQAYRDAEELARAVLPVLRGDEGHLALLLEHEKLSVCEIAARVLARRGDLRALPVLVKAAVSTWEDPLTTRRPLAHDARPARRDRYVSLRDAIVGLGHPALATLGRILAASANTRERVLCESAIVRISEPTVSAKLEAASRVPHRGFAMHGGPGLGVYQAAGRQLARAVGEKAIPLLEEVVAFDLSPPGAGIAIWALAEFKRDRSIPVIVESAKTLRIYVRRGESVIAAALREFGEEGIEAAKKVPAPDPQKARYSGRARRHSVATKTLALAKEIKGVENILEGLAQRKGDAKDYYPWLRRMKTFLKLADQYQDKRFVDAILRVLKESPKDLWQYALPVLGAYDDERVVPTCVGFLGRYRVSSGPNSAVKALTRRLRTDVPEFLVGVLKKAEDPKVRAGAARGLGKLVAWGGRDYWSVVISDMEGQKKAVTKTRETAMPALIDALGDPGRAVQSDAAEALVRLSSEYGTPLTITDERAVKPLIAWVRSRGNPPGRVVEYLVACRDPSAAPALLAAYRAASFKNDHLLRAIGALGYTGAVPDIARALDRRIRDKNYRWGIHELEVLGKLGPAGIAKLLDAFRNCPDLLLRVGAAAALGERGHREAFDEIHELFEELVSRGNSDPRLKQEGLNRRLGLQHCVNSLAGALSSLDAKRAYPLLSVAVVRVEDKGARDRLLWHLRRLEESDPTLRALPVSLPETP